MDRNANGQDHAAACARALAANCSIQAEARSVYGDHLTEQQCLERVVAARWPNLPERDAHAAAAAHYEIDLPARPTRTAAEAWDRAYDDAGNWVSSLSEDEQDRLAEALGYERPDGRDFTADIALFVLDNDRYPTPEDFAPLCSRETAEHMNSLVQRAAA